MKPKRLLAFHFTGMLFGILIATTAGTLWSLFEFALSFAAMWKLYQFFDATDKIEEARAL